MLLLDTVLELYKSAGRVLRTILSRHAETEAVEI